MCEKVEELMALGIDAFASGNHAFDVRDMEQLYDVPSLPFIRDNSCSDATP